MDPQKSRSSSQISRMMLLQEAKKNSPSSCCRARRDLKTNHLQANKSETFLQQKRMESSEKVSRKIIHKVTAISSVASYTGRFKGGNGKGGYSHVLACTLSLRCQASNRAVTKMQHPRLIEGQPNCARQSLASALSALAVGAASCCHLGRHGKVITKETKKMGKFVEPHLHQPH